MKLEEKLASLRKAKGLSQLNLAEKVGVSRQAISRWEAGVAKPTTENLKSLGELFNVSLDYLLNDDASELVNEELKPSKEEVANGTKKKNRKIVIVFIVAVLVLAGFCVVLFGSRGKETVSMGEIEGSDMITVDDFGMDW